MLSMVFSPLTAELFFLSIGNVIFSTALLLGPHLTPRDVENGLWAKGNVISCDVVAFVGQVGNTFNQLYTVGKYVTIYHIRIFHMILL